MPGWTEPFTRNLAGLLAPGLVAAVCRPVWRWLQFAPLVVAQAVAIALMMRTVEPGDGAAGQTWVLISSRTTVVSTRRPRIQEQSRRAWIQIRGHDSCREAA